MSVLIQISDPHFGTERADAVEQLVQLVAHQQPQLVVMSGDITQRARRSQFRKVESFVGRLRCPVLAVPGNHDIPLFNLVARWLYPYAGFRRSFGENLEPEFSSPGLHVVGVNSSRASRHKDGVLDCDTVERACSRLRAGSSGQLRIVAMHHPLLAITEADRENLAHGHVEAIAAFSAAGADLILGGHIHLPYVRPFPTCVDARRSSMWAVQAGTAVSTRVRGEQPNSINIIRHLPMQRAQVVVEQWDLDPDAERFVMVRTVPIAYSRGAGGSADRQPGQ